MFFFISLLLTSTSTLFFSSSFSPLLPWYRVLHGGCSLSFAHTHGHIHIHTHTCMHTHSQTNRQYNWGTVDPASFRFGRAPSNVHLASSKSVEGMYASEKNSRCSSRSLTFLVYQCVCVRARFSASSYSSAQAREI